MVNASYDIYISKVNDPRINLALEEYFLSTVGDHSVIILFWQSENAVVIGRNQNPFEECNISRLESDQVILVRRLSGGGAVYHDLGNLNFSFIAKDAHFEIDKNFEIVLSALKELNIDGVFNGRNDLIVHQRKFSGNAFIHEEDKHLHHGTILVNSNIQKVGDYLSVSHLKLDNKGFDSVKSRVINLSEINKSITVSKIIDKVCDVVKVKSGNEITITKIYEDTFDLKEYKKKYFSHSWNYGDCPDFKFKAEDRFQWGGITVYLDIDNGIIKRADLFTDALNSEAFCTLIKAFKDIELTYTAVMTLISSSSLDQEIQKDLFNFFNENLFK